MTSEEYIDRIQTRYPEETRYYKHINNWIDHYQCSNDGIIKSLERMVVHGCGFRKIKERILKPRQNNKGYFEVNLCRDRKNKMFLVSRLICTAFHGECPKGMECLHRDNDPTNNHESNLYWGTRIENQHDRIANGTAPRGENHGNHKLTQLQVNEIRRLYATEKYYHKDLAIKFSVSISQITKIINYLTWKYSQH